MSVTTISSKISFSNLLNWFDNCDQNQWFWSQICIINNQWFSEIRDENCDLSILKRRYEKNSALEFSYDTCSNSTSLAVKITAEEIVIVIGGSAHGGIQSLEDVGLLRIGKKWTAVTDSARYSPADICGYIAYLESQRDSFSEERKAQYYASVRKHDAVFKSKFKNSKIFPVSYTEVMETLSAGRRNILVEPCSTGGVKIYYQDDFDLPFELWLLLSTKNKIETADFKFVKKMGVYSASYEMLKFVKNWEVTGDGRLISFRFRTKPELKVFEKTFNL